MTMTRVAACILAALFVSPGLVPVEANAPPRVATVLTLAPAPNRVPYVPPQCYARTQDGATAHQGCFTCHTSSLAPNYADDEDLQTTRSFPRVATTNAWTGTFAPTPQAPWSDDATLAWVRADNYEALRSRGRDYAAWSPDCRFSPDDDGFDRDPAGVRTGWRAYTSVPFPGMFWPTNGSAGDAFLRLPDAFGRDASGRESVDVLRLNLAILEAYVRRIEVAIPETDERVYDADLDGDGRLTRATRVAFVWPPRPTARAHWVGMAAHVDPVIDGLPTAGLYPRGTEIVHSVRYLDVVNGTARMARRMKEVRYMRKARFLGYAELDQLASAEGREAAQNPDRLEAIRGDEARGVGTGRGWLLSGYIEDRTGELRPQSYEETAYCVGCHGGVGATTDGTFGFARKVAWQHPTRWTEPIAELRLADGRGEYARYLALVGGGDDYRANDEVRARFFHADGSLDEARAKDFAKDVSLLVMPSGERALALDRAYVTLVRTQAFTRGRDVFLGTPDVLRDVTQDSPTGVVEIAHGR